MKKQNTSTAPQDPTTILPDNYDLRTVQINVFQKYRQIFVFSADMADIAAANQKNLIRESKGYVMLTDRNDRFHLKIWQAGNNVFFEQLGKNDNVPTRSHSESFVFTAHAGCIFLGYKTDDDGNLSGYLIVGTGDFRNIALPLDNVDLKYWALPGSNEPIVIECTGNFNLTIHANQASS